MSLFENDNYQWRETYFVLFQQERRPSAKEVVESLSELGGRYELTDVKEDEQGRLNSVTLYSPDDNAALDLNYLQGDEVTEHAQELGDQMKKTTADEHELELIEQFPMMDARFDVYHFEQLTFSERSEEDEFLDPGALLVVLEQLTALCQGIGVDPQSGSLMSA